MFCNKCGKQLTEDTTFCPECGNKIEKEVETIFCNKCGKKLEGDTTFCPECGNKIASDVVNNNVIQTNTSKINTNVTQTNISNINTNVAQTNIKPAITPVQQQYQVPQYQAQQYNTGYNNQYYPYTPRKKGGAIGAFIVLIIVGVLGYLFISSGGADILIDSPEISNGYSGSGTSTGGSKRRTSGQTVVELDNRYQNATLNSANDVYEYIRKDSEKQKASCPSEIQSIEKKIMNDFGITAVNLCEIDVNFARGLYDSIKWVYNYFPSIRGHLTNLSITNMTESGVIAFYRPMFEFVYEGNINNPNKIGIKMTIALNATYYLNESKLTQDINDSSASGHFPKNATKYSPLVHEFGHYTSFIALMKSKGLSSAIIWDNANNNIINDIARDFGEGAFSKQLIQEAYNAYIRDGNPQLDFDGFRRSISKYAMARDPQGEFIYDETIAESVHDVYLNGNNAATASKYIVNTLKRHVEG